MFNKQAPGVRPGSDDATLDGHDRPSVSTAGGAGRRRMPLWLVEGTESGLTAETRCLLRSRLRISALVMFCGFATFLVWIAIAPDSADGPSHGLARRPCVRHARAGHVRRGTLPAVRSQRAILADGRVRRCSDCPPASSFFYQHHYTVSWAAEYQVLPNMMSMWLMLVFTYALFIPNAWQRAAVVLSILAVAPIGMTVYLASVASGGGRCPQRRCARIVVQSALMMLTVGDCRHDRCPHHRAFASGSV